MRLDVPLFTQTSDFSCGSACVGMALKYFNFVSELNRDLEYELWRETNAVEMKGAGSLIERAKTYIKANGGNEGYLLFFHDMQKRVCAMNGTTQEVRKPTLQDIREAVQSDRVCIALVSTIIFEEEDEDIPHWIVITGEDNGILTVNNPIDEDSSKSHRPIHFEDLYTNVEMYQETTLITVGKKALDKELVPEPALSTKYLEYVR